MGCEGWAGLRGAGTHTPCQPPTTCLFYFGKKTQKNRKSWKPKDNEVNSRKWKRQQAQGLSASRQVLPKSCWQLSRATVAGFPKGAPTPAPLKTALLSALHQLLWLPSWEGTQSFTDGRGDTGSIVRSEAPGKGPLGEPGCSLGGATDTSSQTAPASGGALPRRQTAQPTWPKAPPEAAAE